MEYLYLNIYIMGRKAIYDTFGSRSQVWHDNAVKTKGGLFKEDMKMNPRGKIVSKKASDTAKRLNRLENAGYKTEKGKFELFKKK